MSCHWAIVFQDNNDKHVPTEALRRTLARSVFYRYRVKSATCDWNKKIGITYLVLSIPLLRYKEDFLFIVYDMMTTDDVQYGISRIKNAKWGTHKASTVSSKDIEISASWLGCSGSIHVYGHRNMPRGQEGSFVTNNTPRVSVLTLSIW